MHQVKPSAEGTVDAQWPDRSKQLYWRTVVSAGGFVGHRRSSERIAVREELQQPILARKTSGKYSSRTLDLGTRHAIAVYIY